MRTIILLVSLLLAASPATAERLCVDPQNSKFSIHVDSGGLFGAFAHDHTVEAHDIKGCANIDWMKLDQSTVELVFASAGVKVMDPDHPKDRPKVQEAMETQVLQLNKFPEIRFKSTAVRSRSAESITVDGDLTIRDRTRRVTLNLTVKKINQTTAEIAGRQTLRQSDFGIKPVKVMGGMVKVKDEIQTEFKLVLK
jgi:polyisoprenoid-binding protein YceI